VAQIVLREPRVRNVRVSVRNVGVIAGYYVGIEIRRERRARAADVPNSGPGQAVDAFFVRRTPRLTSLPSISIW
jgi:hypothetical protein